MSMILEYFHELKKEKLRMALTILGVCWGMANIVLMLSVGDALFRQFKKAFPDNFKQYKAACDRKELRPGKMFVYDLNSWHNPRYVINFPTKRHWKGKSRMEDIEAGLQALVKEVRQRGIQSIAIPPFHSYRGLIFEHFDVGLRHNCCYHQLSMVIWFC